MKLPVPVNGSRICTSFARKRGLELGLKHVLDAGDHEIHERLRGVDDAVGVGNLHAEALEETLVDGIEKPLLLAEVADRLGGLFDGDVKVLEALDEVRRG